MALIHCPECGKEISDQAPACIHCGYPLQKSDGAEPPKQFSVVLTHLPSYVDDQHALWYLSSKLGISRESAQALVDQAPSVLASGLDQEDAWQLERQFKRHGLPCKVVKGDRADSPECAPPPREVHTPLSFGMTVLAAALGVLAAALFLALIF